MSYIVEINYTSNYLKIFFWRILSLSTGFLSLLVVVPQLSLNKELYGIFTFCLTFNLYLTYADIGFLSAGQKYAAEEYAKGNRNLEIKYLGFTGFVLFCMLIPFSVVMIYLSFNPSYVISNLSFGNSKIVSKLLLIIGILSPVQIILQRLAQSILIIRIKDYISLRIDIFFNLAKIISVFYFFSNTRYLVVDYFLFTNILTIFSSIIIIIYIKFQENYDFLKLFKSFRFDKFCYKQSNKLAYVSLIGTISWLIYYELDLFFIGKIFGPQEVAIYAIGFTVLNFLRNLWNIIYSPFAQRFNHYIATDSTQELKVLTFQLVNYTFPLCVISVLILLISADKLITAWVGFEYASSIFILQILLFGTLFNFVLQPASYYFNSTSNYFYLKLNAFILPIVFLFSVSILVPYLGIKGFALAKVLALFTSAIISFNGIRHIVNIKVIFKEWYLSLIFNTLLVYFGLNYFIVLIFDKMEKSKFDLIMLIGLILAWLFMIVIVTLVMNRSLRAIFLGWLNRYVLKQ